MALLWGEGFSTYGSNADANRLSNLFYLSDGFHVNYARFAGQGITMVDAAKYYKEEVPGTPATIIFGRAIYLYDPETPTYHTSYPLFLLYDAFPTGNIHLKFHINASRLIEVRDGAGSLIATTSGHSIEASTWYYVEVKAIISNTVGQITIRVNEMQVLGTSADEDTQNGSNVYVKCIYTAGVHGAIQTFFDDGYICDTSGSKNNDFLGDIRVDEDVPDAAGAHTDFTPSAGSNYQNVDETPGPDSDTTYNDGSSVNDQDSYGLPALPAPAGTTIHAVIDQITVRKTDAGLRKCKILTRQSGTDYLGSEIVLSDSFTTETRVMENNPADSLAWEDADISGGEIGVEVTA